MINISPPTPLERFFAHMGWDVYVRSHEDFPFQNFRTSLDFVARKIYVNWEDRRTGELGAYGEDVDVFPSPTLVASFLLLAGPLDGPKAYRNKIMNRRGWDRNRNLWR